jgi:hypothetical protein
MPRQKTDAQLEAHFQNRILKPRLRRMFPGCTIQKFSDFQQGYPDLIILWNCMWAVLEVKAAHNSPEQPNQRPWIEHFSQQTFAAFIYPENMEEVLDGLQRSFESSRSACVPQPQ